MDCDEIIKGSITTNRSTKREKRVRIRETCENENKLEEKGLESDDEFEKEMNSVFEERLQQAELNGGIISSIHKKVQDKENDIKSKSQTIPSSSKSSYDPIYFDSDDDSDNETSLGLPKFSDTKGNKSKNRQILSNEELMYDPELDDQDQTWADNIRNSYVTGNSSGISADNPKPLKNSSAVLNCPACFVVLCIDCQQHEAYQHQFRAMFVMNCKADTTKKLTFPVIKSKSKKKRKTDQQTEFNNEADPEEIFNPVKCNQCSTQVAMFDSDEVYHFFNVLASHG